MPAVPLKTKAVLELSVLILFACYGIFVTVYLSFLVRFELLLNYQENVQSSNPEQRLFCFALL